MGVSENRGYPFKGFVRARIILVGGRTRGPLFWELPR